MINKNYRLFAPQGYRDLSEQAKREICNGCGAASAVVDFIPDTIYGVDISECCNIHDYMYAMADPDIEQKKEADRVLLNNLLRVINAKSGNRFMRLLRSLRALIYYLAVKHFGGPAFWSGKN